MVENIMDNSTYLMAHLLKGYAKHVDVILDSSNIRVEEIAYHTMNKHKIESRYLLQGETHAILYPMLNQYLIRGTIFRCVKMPGSGSKLLPCAALASM
jgi:hypothetical protein